MHIIIISGYAISLYSLLSDYMYNIEIVIKNQYKTHLLYRISISTLIYNHSIIFPMEMCVDLSLLLL